MLTSHGGHLELLERLSGALGGYDRVWITPPSAQADALRARGERVREVVNPWRSPRLVVRNLRQAGRHLRAERPAVVVTAGAGVAVPGCLLARAMGIPLVTVETMARTDRPSASWRILSPFAAHALVQWPGLAARHPRAELCRPALLEDVGAEAAPPGTGTFVTAGSHGVPFDRLLALVDDAARDGVLPPPVVVQGRPGPTRLSHVAPVDVLSQDEMRAALRSAEVVVCHGGAAAIAAALRAGRLPVVLPRRGSLGEHFDDHQVEMVAAIAELGLAVDLDEVPLAEAVARARAAEVSTEQVRRLPGPALVERLEQVVRELAGP